MPYSVTEINEAIRRDPAGFARDCDAAYMEKVRNRSEERRVGKEC